MDRTAFIVAVCLAVATCDAARLEPVEAFQGRALLANNISLGPLTVSFDNKNGSFQTGLDYKGPLGLLEGTSKTVSGFTNGTLFVNNDHAIATSILPNRTTILSENRGGAVGTGIGGAQVTGGNALVTIQNGTSITQVLGLQGSGQLKSGAANIVGATITTLNGTILNQNTFGTVSQPFRGAFGRKLQ